MTNKTPAPGNAPGLPKTPLRAPITEDDMVNLYGLALAMEVCSDVIDGLLDPETAKRALPSLVRLHREEIMRLMQHASESSKGA